MSINIIKNKESGLYAPSIFGIETIDEVTAVKEIEPLLKEIMDKLNNPNKPCYKSYITQ
ncbi:MAG: hypothetical protein PUB21_11850 [Bacteroidales bacterium]|nr:hypothetical protein [Bacteroidales bacterium]